MSDGNELLDAIAADPDSADKYSRYAGWLSGQGDPRGEFIRVRLALEQDLTAPEREVLEGRQAALLEEHAETWIGAKLCKYIGDWRTHARFQRGFLNSVTFAAGHDPFHAPGLAAALLNVQCHNLREINNIHPSTLLRVVQQVVLPCDAVAMSEFDRHGPRPCEEDLSALFAGLPRLQQLWTEVSEPAVLRMLCRAVDRPVERLWIDIGQGRDGVCELNVDGIRSIVDDSRFRELRVMDDGYWSGVVLNFFRGTDGGLCELRIDLVKLAQGSLPTHRLDVSCSWRNAEFELKRLFRQDSVSVNFVIHPDLFGDATYEWMILRNDDLNRRASLSLCAGDVTFHASKSPKGRHTVLRAHASSVSQIEEVSRIVGTMIRATVTAFHLSYPRALEYDARASLVLTQLRNCLLELDLDEVIVRAEDA